MVEHQVRVVRVWNQWIFYCRPCKAVHRHGAPKELAEPGNRQSHCTSHESPLFGVDYRLVEAQNDGIEFAACTCGHQLVRGAKSWRHIRDGNLSPQCPECKCHHPETAEGARDSQSGAEVSKKEDWCAGDAGLLTVSQRSVPKYKGVTNGS